MINPLDTFTIRVWGKFVPDVPKGEKYNSIIVLFELEPIEAKACLTSSLPLDDEIVVNSTPARFNPAPKGFFLALIDDAVYYSPLSSLYEGYKTS
jgi:hypothetical protein